MIKPTVASGEEPLVFVDAHVHLHDCYDVESFLDGAVSHIQKHRSDNVDIQNPAFLLLADMIGQDAFARITSAKLSSRWQVEITQEKVSMVIERNDGLKLVLVAGRQIACREGLELLALGNLGNFADGRKLRETLDEIYDSGGVAVLPWGFGKWTFERGNIVRKLIIEMHKRNSADQNFFLGDNAGRSAILSLPVAFRIAREHGLSVLPGSDPLPFRSHQRGAGQFGFVAACKIGAAAPWRDLRTLLSTDPFSIIPVGQLKPFIPFVLSQFKMQLRKRGLILQ